MDLVPAYRPLTLAELSGEPRQEDAETRRWRLLQEFLRGYGDVVPSDRPSLISEAPAPVDARWDALLGGVAEHLAFHGRLPVPAWSLPAGCGSSGQHWHARRERLGVRGERPRSFLPRLDE